MRKRERALGHTQEKVAWHNLGVATHSNPALPLVAALWLEENEWFFHWRARKQESWTAGLRVQGQPLHFVLHCLRMCWPPRIAERIRILSFSEQNQLICLLTSYFAIYKMSLFVYKKKISYESREHFYLGNFFALNIPLILLLLQYCISVTMREWNSAPSKNQGYLFFLS